MKILIALVLAGAGFLVHHSRDLEKETLAVLEFTTVGIDRRLGPIVADAVRTTITENRQYIMLRREKMGEILRAYGESLPSDCSEVRCATLLGKVLSVSKIVTGSITLRGKEIYLHTSLIDVLTAQEIRSADMVIPHTEDISPFKKSSKFLGLKLLGKPARKNRIPELATIGAVTVGGTVYLIYRLTRPKTGTVEIIARFPIGGE